MIAAAGGAWAFGRRAIAFGVALVAGAGLIGALRLGEIDRPAKAAPPGAAIEAEATLLERPRAGLFGSSAPMRIETGPAHGLRILARRREVSWPAVDPGVRFRLRGFVKPLEGGSGPGAGGGGGESGRGGGAAGATSAASGDGGSGPGGGAFRSGRSASGRDHGTGAVPSEANAGAPGTPGLGPLPAPPANAFDFAAFLRSRGIGREVELESLQPIGRRGGVAGLVDSLRRRAETGIAAGLSAEQAALARGMVLGEDGDVAETTRDDFRRSGLAHLTAASGQNVALMFALAFPLLMLAGASQRVRIAVLVPLVILYVALAGSGASVLRAGIMATAGLLAIALGRGASAVYSLLLAAVVTLILNPRATGDPGWQLSFVAVAGMLTLGPFLQKPMRRLPRPVAEAVGATVAATLATSPLLAHEFGQVSIAALPANLIAFPAVAPIMWIGMGEAAVEQLAALGLNPLVHAIQSLVAPVAALALRWVAGVATRFSD